MFELKILELVIADSIDVQTYPRTHSYVNEGNYKIVVLAHNIMDNETDSIDVAIECPVTNQWTISSNSPLLFPPGSGQSSF